MIEFALMLCLLSFDAPAQNMAHTREAPPASVTLPFVLDHNRMLVDVEIRRANGTWRTARLWVDTGNPSFFMSEALARDLGVDLSGLESSSLVPPPAHVRIGGKPAVEGAEAGDKLIKIGDLETTGATMGTVVDALRGKPGDIRYLILERGGNKFRIETRVVRLL